MSNTEDVAPENFNPYQAPESPTVDLNPAFVGPELVRHEHLSHETSVKLIGSMYLIIGSVFTIPSIAMAVGIYGMGSNVDQMQGLALLTGLLGISTLGLGFAIRRFSRWARIICGVISAGGMLFAVPVGALFNGSIIYLLYSPKGNVVFSDDYKDVIRQTPHIKYRTSGVVWIFLLLLLLLFVGSSILAWTH